MKTKKQTIFKKLVFILVILSFFISYSQKDTLTFNLSPEGKLETVYDRFGNKLLLKDIFINTSAATQQRAVPIACSSTSFFNLYFDVGSGMENIADPIHNARRAIVCKVFEDVSNFINSPLTTTGNKVNIWVKNIASTAAPSGTLGLASSYYISPNSTTSVISGILDGEIWKTIHLGSDSYANVSSGTNVFYHGQIAFNFADPAIQWHTNLASNAPNTLYDLYTVVLHEVIHALGFTSFIGPNGTSLTNANYYSRYDTFLRSNNNIPLLTTGSCSMYDVNFNPAVSPTVLRPGCTLPNNLGTGTLNTTLCNNAIKYVGSTTVPVYTPTCFEIGSSLGHFEDQLYPTCSSPYGNDTYFLVSNAIGTGVTKRYPKPEERKALCDMGYSLKTIFGVNTTTSGYFNYGGSVCTGITVAGLNDGINSSGGYAFVGTIATTGATSNTVAISNLLTNDVNATGFECLQDINAPTTTTLSATAGTIGTIINFTTTTAGIHLLRYIPTNGTQKGNITYLYVYIVPPPPTGGCSPTPTACDLVMNGGFEQYSSLPNFIYQINKACGWSSATNVSVIAPGGQFTPSYFNSNVTNGINIVYTPAIPCNSYGYQVSKNNIGNGYAGVLSYEMGYGKQHLGTKLKEPLQPNTTYQLSFDVSLLDSRSYFASNLQAALTSNIPNNLTNTYLELDFGTNPYILLTSPTITRNTSGWDTISFNFTTTSGGEQYLSLGLLKNVIYASNTPTIEQNACNHGYMTDWTKPTGYFIDNVSLIPTNGAKFDLPASICNTQTLPDLSAYLTGEFSNGTFSGPGVINANGVYSFNSLAAGGIGSITIGYSYYNEYRCLITLYDTILITSSSTSSITVDAINDNFSSMPINGSVGGITTSVYANDLYNGLPTSSATLQNISFTLVTPLAISGATINGMGLISIPAGTSEGTYVLTYTLSVVGNCSFSDIGTVTILVVNNSTPTIVPGLRANNTVNSVGLQSTGKIIISGFFSSYNNIVKNKIARLNTDLTLDQTFISAGESPINVNPQSIAIQSDNKIIVAGVFTGYSGGTNGFGIARLLPDGAIDTSFNVGGTGVDWRSGYASKKPYACVVQTDGKILLGGDFYYYNGVQKLGIVRINNDGSVDSTFNPIELNQYYRSVVRSIFVQSDGKILLLGSFTAASTGATEKNIIRLNANGTLDTNFLKGDTIGSTLLGNISVSLASPLAKIVVQPNGNIIVVGAFTKYNGTNVNCIIRLLPTGQIDPTFNIVSGVDRAINEVILETITNKIIIGGEFTTFNGIAVKKMIRLNINGNLDTTFNIGTGTKGAQSLSVHYIKVLKLQQDGKIIVGGQFTTFNGLSATNITRIFGSSGVQARSSVQVFQSEPEIDTNPNYNSILVYPNPSKGIFNIDLSQETEAYNTVTIFNILGEKVFSSTLVAKENNSINLSHLANGYYLAKLENQANSVTLKLIKN